MCGKLRKTVQSIQEQEGDEGTSQPPISKTISIVTLKRAGLNNLGPLSKFSTQIYKVVQI
jgi:hypothetical protein